MNARIADKFRTIQPTCYVVGHNAEIRLKLAKAEAWAEDEGLEVLTMHDDMPWDGDAPEPKELIGVVLVRPCPVHGTDCKHADVLGSLWSVGLTGDSREDSAYVRSIAAELALEAM